MSTVQERLGALREAMAQRKMDAYVVVTADFHGSEYVGEYFKCRQYLSGFTGSAGTLVVTKDEACLWTDGRYFVQAAAQLAGSSVTLMKMREEGVPTVEEYLSEHLPQNGVLGFDGRTVSGSWGEQMKETLADKQVTFSCMEDLAGEVWEDRPALSAEPAWALDVRYAGKSAAEKIANLRDAMAREKADVHVLTSLDDIAWLLNIRGNDILHNPVALSYLMVGADWIQLFVNEEILKSRAYPYLDNMGNTQTTREYLETLGIEILPYDAIYAQAEKLNNQRVLMDCTKVNYALCSQIEKNNTVIAKGNPTTLAKAVKNPVEMENTRRAHIKDGVAVTRFMYWLKHTVGKEYVDEISAAEKLESFRMQQEGYLGPSFSTISAYGANAAMCHYTATPETNTQVMPKGMYLVDSGGQYYEGTTDITRTIAVGPLSNEEREHFTLVLMGMLRLGASKFLYGTTGITLDYAAREPLWQRGLDFNHGTGHGVGYLLNVHEGPNSIRCRFATGASAGAVMEEGMVTSDEPGLYIEGSHGIRTENLTLCVKAEKTAFGQFMKLEFLTWVPIDCDAIDISVMTDRDITLLNEYHREVYEKIAPYLPQNEAEWLREVTAPVGRE